MTGTVYKEQKKKIEPHDSVYLTALSARVTSLDLI